MHRTTGWRARVVGISGVLAAGVAIGFLTAGPAGANDDLDKYQGDKKNVSVTSDRSYDDQTNRTTFTFTLSATENVSHVVLMACEGIEIVSATGPNGAAKEGDAPKNDPSIDDQEQHVGIKFEPGVPGTYTIVFVGNIAGADFVVKDGDGHKHFPNGGEVCKPVTTPQTPSTPSEETPPQNNPLQNDAPSNDPPSNNPPAALASNQPSEPDTEVQGSSTASNPGPDVLGSQVTAPEAQGNTLPRTGVPLPVLAPIGTALLALGGVATALGRRPQG